MGFSDLNFLLRFLPVFLFIYYVFPAKWRNVFLFLASVATLLLEDVYSAAVLACAVLVNFGLILLIQKSNGKRRKLYFIAFLVLNIGFLMAFKLLADRLPLGISFYTFMALSCGIDVYLRKTELTGFIEFGTFFTMFPKLIQGPIVPYKDMKAELLGREYKKSNVESGLALFVVGLGFKVLIADKMGLLWGQIQTVGFESISTLFAWVGVMAFSMQLYFDFWGYSLMAKGLGQMLGFTIPKNFDHPYSSYTVSEYYRRWHITLGRWFRDYIYIPMGGSRCGKGRLLLNLVVVWLLTGIWHGITWNFLIWAGVLCAFIILEKFCWGDFLQRHRLVAAAYIWFIIPLTWIVFAIPEISNIGIYFSRLFPFFGGSGWANVSDAMHYGMRYVWLVLVAGILSTKRAEKIYRKNETRVWMKLLLLLVFWLSVYEIANGANNPFMYSGF